MTCGNIAGGMHSHAVVSACMVSALTGSTGCLLQLKENVFLSQYNIKKHAVHFCVNTNQLMAVKQKNRFPDVLKGTNVAH